jgi:hypothetical protein
LIAYPITRMKQLFTSLLNQSTKIFERHPTANKSMSI